MDEVVIFATGSSILVDIEESLRQAKLRIRAAVKNRDGESFLTDRQCEIAPAQVTPVLSALPHIVPLFTPAHRQVAAREAEALGFRRPLTLVDPSSRLPAQGKYGAGLYVNAGVVLGAASSFDEFIFINRAASVGHHAVFGRFVSIGPGVVIAGQVTLGKGVTIGAGAVVLPKITIGDNAIVGAGSVVTRDVPAHCLAIGNPARVVKQDIPGYDGKSVE